jgi:hypothetical protein
LVKGFRVVRVTAERRGEEPLDQNPLDPLSIMPFILPGVDPPGSESEVSR